MHKNFFVLLILIFAFYPHNLYAQYSANNGTHPSTQPIDKYKTYVDERKLNVYRSYGFRDWYFGMGLGYVITPKKTDTLQNRKVDYKQSNGANLGFEGGFHINRWVSFGLAADLERSAQKVVINGTNERLANTQTQRFSIAPILTFWPVGSDQKIYLPYIGLGLGQSFSKTSLTAKNDSGLSNQDVGDSGLSLKFKWGMDFSLDSSLRVGFSHNHIFLDILANPNKQIDIFSLHASADF